MKLLPRTLTGRLVVTAVALVAVVGLLVGLSATLVMRNILTDRLDEQVVDTVRRAPRGDLESLGGRTPPGRGTEGQPGPSGPSGPQSAGTLYAVLVEDRASSAGTVLTRDGTRDPLAGRDLVRLAGLDPSARPQPVQISGTGYRVVVVPTPAGPSLVVGLPTTEIDETLKSLVSTFGLLTILGTGLALLAGTGLVRHQLRPLREVALAAQQVSSQNLSDGETTISTRVAPDLADRATEVGQVGAALNTLLDHVGTALDDRHRSEQQVRQFVADASHELRTPLATIHGYAELSRRTPADPEVIATALRKVETEAGRMSALVEDLLLLARLDSGRPLLRGDVDLTRLLLEAVADARVLAPAHRWQLQLPEDPVTVEGDTDRLHQVVTNLLTNARNHTPEGTTITVAVRAGEQGGVRIEVHDDGPGLSPELAQSAFERFTRGDGSRTRASGGAGLGLSLVSAITQAHGGRAAVTSRPGSTTFTVELP